MPVIVIRRGRTIAGQWLRRRIGWRRRVRSTRLLHHHPTLNPRNAEVSRKVQEVNGTDRARNRNQRHRIGTSYKERDIPDGVVFEMQPEVGALRIAVFLMSVRQVLPAGRVVVLADGIEEL